MSNNNNQVVPPVGGATIIDENAYNTLVGIFKSGDQENFVIGQMILTSCNVKESIYYIWKLSREVYVNNLVNLRTKAGRKFRDECHLFSMCSMGDRNFAEFLLRQNWLTTDIFTLLEEEITKTTERQVRNKFYDVKLELKDEYKIYSNKYNNEKDTENN
jgi:hypothetical protein